MHVRPRRSFRAQALRLTLLVVAVLVLAYLALSGSARSARQLHPTLAQVWPAPPLVIAHQGGDDLFPSSTRFAYDAAAVMGADVLEMDVHLAADGQLVVLHDDTVDRTTDGTGPVVALRSDQLAALDAGHDWSPDRAGEAFPYRGQGHGVPRLVEVLDDHPAAPLLIEVKPDGAAAAQALCAVLRAQGRSADAVVSSFHQDATDAFRAACPEVATGAAPDEVRTFLILARARLAGAYRPPFDALQVPVRQGSIEVITPAFVRAAHAAGVQVHAWTIDDAAEMDRLLALGVDGLITDRPDRALRATGREPAPGSVPAFARP